jgi:radical SAM-linked protein
MAVEPPHVGSAKDHAPVADTSCSATQEHRDGRTRVRIRFRKDGDLRWVSHHDLMNCFERMLRRADLPVHVSQGFHPKPRMVFALSLALGLVGQAEVLDLELERPMDIEEVHRRLAAAAPPGLEIASVGCVSGRGAPQVRRACYCLEIPPERCPGLDDRIAALLAAAHLWVERQRPEPRRLDVRPYLDDLKLTQGRLEMALRVTPNGTARPEEILRLLDLYDLFEAGAVIVRTGLELHEEKETT